MTVRLISSEQSEIQKSSLSLMLLTAPGFNKDVQCHTTSYCFLWLTRQYCTRDIQNQIDCTKDTEIKNIPYLSPFATYMHFGTASSAVLNQIFLGQNTRHFVTTENLGASYLFTFL